MEYNNSNKEQFDNHLGIHDAEIELFNYDYNNKTVYIQFNNLSWENKQFEMIFTNVINIDIQGCNFWGSGYNVMEIYVSNDDITINKLKQTKRENSNFSDIFIEGIEKYIEACIQMNSGDIIKILCEKIIVNDK